MPDDILSAIGAVTVSFGLLEHQVGLLAGSMLGQPPLVCGAITSALSFRKLCGLVLDLAEMNFADDDPRRQGFVELIKRARPLEEDRNRISHSLWGAGRTDGAVTRIKATPSRAKEGFHLKTEEHSAASLREIAERMNVLSTDITNFLTARRTSRSCRHQPNLDWDAFNYALARHIADRNGAHRDQRIKSEFLTTNSLSAGSGIRRG